MRGTRFVTRQTVLCTTPFSFGMKKLGKSILWHTVCINKKAGACSRLFVYARFYTLRRYPRILGREFDADAPSARCLCREGGRAAAEEGIKYRPAFRDDAHELRHERNRLACEMDFFGAVYRIPENAGQALACVPLKTSLGAIDDILGVTPELTGIGRAEGLCQTTSPRHIQPAACTASVTLGSCLQSVKTRSGAPSRAMRQHSQSHCVIHHVKER